MVSIGKHIRAIILEYGVVNAKGEIGLRKSVATALDGLSEMPTPLVTTIAMMWQQYLNLKFELKQLEKTKNALTRQIEPCRRLMDLEGVAETTASILYVTLGNGNQFKNGRQASAFVGLTPKQHSSGGKTIMLGINKTGGVKNLRSLLYLGAMSYLARLPEVATTQKQAWLIELIKRIGFKRTCIALANKTVRTAWAMLHYETKYQSIPVTA
ncbi:transposase [Photobacterium frigidiphilum]